MNTHGSLGLRQINSIINPMKLGKPFPLLFSAHAIGEEVRIKAIRNGYIFILEVW